MGEGFPIVDADPDLADETRQHEADLGLVPVVHRADVELAHLERAADHRGILSWHAQLKDRKLREAGSDGYLLRANIPAEALQQAAKTGELLLRLTVEEGLPGGLAIYGAEFGRYPVEPTVVLVGR